MKPQVIDWNDYVQAMSAIQGLELAPESRAEVVLQLQRIESIVAPLLAVKLQAHDEPAPVFRL